MATAPMSPDTSRLSFAKVAASAGKENVALTSLAKIVAAPSTRDDRKENQRMHSVQKEALNYKTSLTSSNISKVLTETPQTPGSSIITSSDETSPGPTHDDSVEANLVDAVRALQVNPTPSLVVNGSGRTGSKGDISENFSEDSRADSNSELGTKPPSLDGKSIASGTTFALDEKESLRPDDSASVMAAEDDDTFSGRGSIVAGSRIGSEAAARAYHKQLYDLPDRRNIQLMQERQSQGIITPQSGSSGPQTIDESKTKPLVGAAGTPEAFNLFYRQEPDEKLLEALESPKDRIFLLRLEQDVIEFIKDSKEPFIDLPPCNSFCRMLTHKLADYYHMTHQVEPVAGSVRIFRTPFCRLPPSLTSISNPPTSESTPPPMPAMKIMRRGGDGDTGPTSSKATSDVGSDGKDKAAAKEKLSREEREAAYNKARERIFGKEDKSGDATPETEGGNEMSRSSSLSTKDKSSQGKRMKSTKQRRDDSEPFDVRSQYTPYFPQPQVPPWEQGMQYRPISSHQYNGPTQNSYQGPIPTQFVQNPQFNQNIMNSNGMQPFSNISQQFSQPSQARFQTHSAPITTYGSPIQPPQTGNHQWSQQTAYQVPYQPRVPVVGAPNSSIPYPFGQLPTTVNPSDPKSQHPIPGSFNRHAFNPKTQSFVPSNIGLPTSQPSPQHGSAHHATPHISYGPYGQHQQPFGNGAGYTMARQGSNNSLSSYHTSPHMSQRPIAHQGMQHGMSVNVPQVIQGISSNGPANHLPNYGNPSTLPPKPPTGH